VAIARRTNRRRYVLLVIVLTCLTLITLDTRNGRSGPIGTLGSLAHRVVSPFQRAANDVANPVSDWWDGTVHNGDLKKENRKLQQEIAALQGNQNSASEAIRENSGLKALLQLTNKLLVKNVAANIVSRGVGNFDPTLEIDKGSNAGIAVDMPVISPEGIVGQVTRVWSTGAQIQVLTDPDFSVGVQTPPHPGSAPTTGIATGANQQHDLTVQFDAGTKVVRGDPIVTSPQSTLFPAGFPVGTISSVTVQPGNIGVTATITPYVHLGALQQLLVLLWTNGTTGPVFVTTTTTSTSSTTTTTVFGATTTTNPFGTTTSTTGPGG